MVANDKGVDGVKVASRLTGSYVTVPESPLTVNVEAFSVLKLIGRSNEAVTTVEICTPDDPSTGVLDITCSPADELALDTVAEATARGLYAINRPQVLRGSEGQGSAASQIPSPSASFHVSRLQLIESQPPV